MAQFRWIVTGISVSSADLPKTVTFASLTPLDGTLPTFNSAPIVSVLSAGTGRNLDTANITTDQFDIVASSAGGAPGTYTVAVEIISITAASATSSATAIAFPYYCSDSDVKDTLVNLSTSFGSSKNLDQPMRRRQISRAYARINGALSQGGYSVPASNSVKQTISESLSASDNTVDMTVQDGDKFDEGDTVRIHGASGSVYNDEFTSILLVSSDVVRVNNLENAYDADGTIELVTIGMQFLRDCNAIGAAAMCGRSLLISQGNSQNEKVNLLMDEFEQCLENLAAGAITLTGLTPTASGQIESYQSKNPNADGVDPVFEWDMVF